MPNHITNRLTVEGAPLAVKNFFAAINGGVEENGDPVAIDFEKIKPMPESLRIESSSRGSNGLMLYAGFVRDNAGLGAVAADLGDYAKQALEGTSDGTDDYIKVKESDPELWKLGQQYYNNIRDYGAPNWYDWSIANWGTKWDAYNQSVIDDNTIEFLTAWSGIPELLCELSEKFPDVAMIYSYADEEWGCNVGEYQFEGGEITYRNVPNAQSEEACRIAEELLGEAFSLDDEDKDEYEDEAEQ